LIEFAPPRQLNRSAQYLMFVHKLYLVVILLLVLSAGNFNCFAVQDRSDSMSIAVYALPRYSRKEMQVHRFLWNKWRWRQVATAELMVYAMDTGNIYTVNIQQDSARRWIITEHARHYWAGPNATVEPTTLVATGIALRRFRLRNGTFIVRLVTEQGKTLPLFE
jgi:hypothetical protein